MQTHNISDFLIVYCTCPDNKTAESIVTSLLNNRLAACVNSISNVSSSYWWEDKIQNDNEILLVIKSKKESFDDLQKTIESLHPYSVPEIIAVPLVFGSDKYLGWIKDNVG